MRQGIIRRNIVVLIMAGLMGLMLLGFYVPQPGGQQSLLPMMPLPKQLGPPKRMVSMAPAITEILFELGCGSAVKGVTNYCQYPSQTETLTKIGGLYDPNYEAILKLNPDLVILLPSHREQRLYFKKLRIRTYTVDLNTLPGIISSIIMLGLITEKEIQAAHLVATFQAAIISSQTPKPMEPKSVLLVINRDYHQQSLHGVYVAGRGDFYDEIITLAGGTNAMTRHYPKYPKLSVEGLLTINPDVVIELIAEPDQIKRSLSSLKGDWLQTPGLKAGRNREIYQLTGNYLVVPGPRLVGLIEEMKAILSRNRL